MQPIVAPTAGNRTFLYSRLVERLDNLSAHIAFLGIPYGNAYDYHAIVNDQANAPAAMRRVSDRHDPFASSATTSTRRAAVRRARRSALSTAAMCAPTSVISRPCDARRAGRCADPCGRRHADRAGRRPRRSDPRAARFEGRGPITLVQIDQHIDWRDEVNGVREGLSSPIRRASEMAHIGEIFQIGLRATGSARAGGGGGRACLRRAPDHRLRTARGRHGRDTRSASPTAAATTSPSTWTVWTRQSLPPSPRHARRRHLRAGAQADPWLVKKGRVVGMDVVEITPATDVNQITCITAGRLIVNLIGMAVRAGYFHLTEITNRRRSRSPDR